METQVLSIVYLDTAKSSALLRDTARWKLPPPASTSYRWVTQWCESVLGFCWPGRDTKRVIDGHRVPLYVNPHKCVTTRGNGDRHAIKMTPAFATFGQSIAKARKAKALSQKDLAGRILKEEDGKAISPQYLNDIEHDRRSPTSDHLIRQFAVVLDIDENTLFVLAGKIPDDVRRDLTDPAKAGAAFMNFRKTVAKR